ncbi:hypothetical protein AJ78_06839 [Emergomyces pasteurianus Ep9510]|uniref:RNase MRP protein 1 RNA binding domain-containing protein n=1 Tax=Emergomyces pasteurianus Ep9510 TaxID=1447872 RepID=A0A1J9Q9K9_9EURO|nr:hypothetical protein AJ78_06839 [Emergomyces pasteurianus Ep9510]
MPPRQRPQSWEERITPPRSPALKSIHTTLHLIYHRNKNQHRGAKWWKWLVMLKRSMGQLVKVVRRWELERERERDDGYDEDGDGGVGAKVLERMQYMHVWVVPRCYAAFSTVVADTQFSALGVVLLAVLAQAARSVADAEEHYPAPAEDPETRAGGKLLPATATASTKHDGNVDVGEVVKRSLYVPSPAAADSASAGEKQMNEPGGEKAKGNGKSPLILGAAKEGRKVGMVQLSKRESSLARSNEGKSEEEVSRQKKEKLEAKRKKKKRRKGDAIDDIFGGL